VRIGRQASLPPAVPTPDSLYDRAYFESDLCEGWQRFREGLGLSDLKRRELELLAPGPGLRILDAGCGRGEVLLACAQKGASVAGADASGAAVAISRETLAGVDADVRAADLVALPWPDASFDRALLADVVEHLAREHAGAALAELRRVLRPGGTLVVHTAPNLRFLQIGWPLTRPLLRATGRRAAADALDRWIAESKRYHVNEQSAGTLRRALRRAGFAQVRTWVDPDVVRGGGHHLTAGLEHGAVLRLGARIAAARPLRAVLGNDVYGLAVR
jgi:ubiquinone/menaquinone biosynthesis C-methylase UbiE